MYTHPPTKRPMLRESVQPCEVQGWQHLVTATTEGLLATPLPLILDEAEGPYGTLYGHLAKANYQWRLPPRGEALALFSGPDAYVTPSWYETKETTGKVVPTWVYVAVHAYGSLEFFDEPGRLHEVVSRLTASTKVVVMNPGPSPTRLPLIFNRS